MSRLSEAWAAWLDSTGDDDGESNRELAEAIRAFVEGDEELDDVGE